MEIKRVFDILENLKNTSSKDDILSAKVNKKWVSHSITDFVNNANYVGSALLHLGLNSGDTVAIMANNMPEWNFVDYGSQQVAMPSVPIFPTISSGDLKYILNLSYFYIFSLFTRIVFFSGYILDKPWLIIIIGILGYFWQLMAFF